MRVGKALQIAQTPKGICAQKRGAARQAVKKALQQLPSGGPLGPIGHRLLKILKGANLALKMGLPLRLDRLEKNP